MVEFLLPRFGWLTVEMPHYLDFWSQYLSFVEALISQPALKIEENYLLMTVENYSLVGYWLGWLEQLVG